MKAHPSLATMVDGVFHQSRQGCYRLTRIHRTGTYTLRIDIQRDSYDHQSRAAVEVLTPDLTWTLLAYTPFTEWHRYTPLLHADAGTLEPYANVLYDRALLILP